ncbi:MAG: flagellar filament capping protein FliD [Mariprofundus sp.]|nr:flagellar filament capping protein FliD [Mariprofundus sp.]
MAVSNSIASIISSQVAGFDAKGAVDGLLGLRQFEISQLQKKQDAITARQDAMLQVNTAVSSLRSTAIGMADSTAFFGYTASLASSSSTVPASTLMDVNGTSNVTAGQHSIIVSQIAEAQRLASSAAVKDNVGTALASATAAMNISGSFQLEGTTVTVSTSDSLNDIAANINQLNTGSSATGVSASVMKVADNDFRLILTSDNTGQAGFSMTGAALNGGGGLANLQLGSLASASAVQTLAAAPVSSSSTVLGLSGTFQVNGTNVTVGATDSLQDVANTITGSVTGVTAAVEKSGSSDFRLVLMGDSASPPANQTITVADPNTLFGTTLAGLQLSASSQTNVISSLQQANDAQISIDGLALSRTTNTITDALSGVTLSLKQADPAVTVNMSIGVDQPALRANVQSFVDSYNTLQSMINDQFAFDPNTGAGGILAGEALLTTIQSSLSSSVLTSIPGLASDRNSLVLIGVEPDVNGQLMINEDRFGTFLANDPTAIRDLFVAQGSSSNNSLQFLTNGLTTPSGTYSVNLTQAAEKAVLPGVQDLSAGLGAAEDVTITDTGTSRQAVINLTQGLSQSAIVAALNAELAANHTEQHNLSTALTASGLPATGSTTFSALGLGVAANDTISINGTLRSGVAVSGSYTVLNPATDSVSGLLSAIQSAFNQEVAASIDANGKVTVTDIATGDSQLTVAVSAGNQGGGTLAFGSDTIVKEGRYAIPVQAVISGTGISLESTSYGSSNAFSITQTVNGLGIADTSAVGKDVLGTINGLSALGTGQLLIGRTGNVDGLGLLYTGSAINAVGDVTVGVGIAASFEGLLDLYTNPAIGLIQSSMQSEQTSFDNLTTRMDDLTRQMEQQRTTLTLQFTRMQQSMASLQSSSSFLNQVYGLSSAQNA